LVSDILIMSVLHQGYSKTLHVLYLHFYSCISFSLFTFDQICGFLFFLKQLIQQALYNFELLKEMSLCSCLLEITY